MNILKISFERSFYSHIRGFLGMGEEHPGLRPGESEDRGQSTAGINPRRRSGKYFPQESLRCFNGKNEKRMAR
jgi:hypothetical protein